MLSNRFAIITGAGGGIGAATARIFVREHVAGVAIVDYNYEAACKIAEELGEVAFPVKCDISNPEQVKDAIAQIASIPSSLLIRSTLKPTSWCLPVTLRSSTPNR